jgi:hypothetical protein
MAKKPIKPSSSNSLLNALDFLSNVTKDEGSPNETHVLLQNKTVTAFNGILAAGVLIEEDIIAAPHNTTIINALKRCKEQFSLTQLDGAKLSIKSGKFRAVVPCIDPALLSWPTPDNPCAVIDDRLKEGLTALEAIKTDNAQRVVIQSFLMNGLSIIATDGKIIIEWWHGINLPIGLAIPKSIIPAITKTSKKLSQFGFSNNSVTFYFEDNSWIRTQLYAEAWPDGVFSLLDRENNAKPLVKGFYEAVEAVAPFSENGFVFLDNGFIKSHRDSEKGATYEVLNLQGSTSYAYRYLNLIKPYVETIDFLVNADVGHGHYAMFYGKQCRGIIAGVG